MQIFDSGQEQRLAFDARTGERVRVVQGRIRLTRSRLGAIISRSGDDVVLDPRGRTPREAIGGTHVIVESLPPAPRRAVRADVVLLPLRMRLLRVAPRPLRARGVQRAPLLLRRVA